MIRIHSTMAYLTVESGSWSPTLTLARLRWASRTHPGVGKSPWHTSAMLIVMPSPPRLLANLLACLPAAAVVVSERPPRAPVDGDDKAWLIAEGRGTKGRPSRSKEEKIADTNRMVLEAPAMMEQVVLFRCVPVAACCGIRSRKAEQCERGAWQDTTQQLLFYTDKYTPPCLRVCGPCLLRSHMRFVIF